MHGVEFYKAMQILSGERHLPFKSRPISNLNTESSFKIEEVRSEIRFYGLMAYLQTRGIDHNLVKGIPNLVEVAFIAKSGKPIIALGFGNDKGGFEIRNNFTKISTRPKAISTIPGHSTILNVFEGFMDYLSALAIYRTPKLKGTTIVLNGVGQKKSLLDELPNYKVINLFLDNDYAGNTLVNEVLNNASNVTNYSKRMYPNHKDFNEFLMNSMKEV